MNNFLKQFEVEKPIIGMLHLGRKSTIKECLELTKKEIDIYLKNGVNGVIVEDYFGDYEEVLKTLEYLYNNKKDIVYGVNYLRDCETAFKLAKEYEANFIQIDSLSGHLRSDDDLKYGNKLDRLRRESNIPVIGGVRFKYQPYLSGRTLEEDLKIGTERSNGIVVTGNATGSETPLEKAKKFREVLDKFPLIIGAGVTADNCAKIMEIGDAAIVGSYFKDNYKDNGEVSEKHVKTLIRKIETLNISNSK